MRKKAEALRMLMSATRPCCLLSVFCLALALEPVRSWCDDFRTVLGDAYQGEVSTIDARGNVSGTGLPAGLKLSDIVGIRRAPLTEPRNPKVVVEGASGLRLYASVLTYNGDTFELTTDGERKIAVPFDSVRAVRFEAGRSAAVVEEALAQKGAEADKVFVKVEKQLESVAGLLAGVSATEVTLEVGGERKSVPLDKVAAIVMASTGTSVTAPLRISLADGSRLTASSVELAADQWQVKLPWGQSMSLPKGAVAELENHPPGIVFISDLEPISVVEEPLLTQASPWRKDRSLGGGSLQLDGEKFNKGLGVHPRSELTFPLTEPFDLFLATVGIDDEVAREATNLKGGLGDCECSVLGDGRVLWTGRIRGGEPPVKLKVNIAKVERLTLLVEPGEDFDFADHVDWCDARVLKISK